VTDTHMLAFNILYELPDVVRGLFQKDKDSKKSAAKRQTLAVVVEVLCRPGTATALLDADVVGADYVVATRAVSTMFELSTTRTLMRELEAADKGASASAAEGGPGKKTSKSKSTTTTGSSSSSSSKSNSKSSSSRGRDKESSGKKKKRSGRDRSTAPSIEPRSRKKMTRMEEVKKTWNKLFFARTVELPDERDLNAIEEGTVSGDDDDKYDDDDDEEEDVDEEEEEAEGSNNNQGMQVFVCQSSNARCSTCYIYII
jgi:hypothetical protein